MVHRRPLRLTLRPRSDLKHNGNRGGNLHFTVFSMLTSILWYVCHMRIVCHCDNKQSCKYTLRIVRSFGVLGETLSSFPSRYDSTAWYHHILASLPRRILHLLLASAEDPRRVPYGLSWSYSHVPLMSILHELHNIYMQQPRPGRRVHDTVTQQHDI